MRVHSELGTSHDLAFHLMFHIQMTKAVLGDAIALVRGDRFYTTSYTPVRMYISLFFSKINMYLSFLISKASMTAWGFQDCKRDSNNGGLGGNLPKLLARNLSRHYPFVSLHFCILKFMK